MREQKHWRQSDRHFPKVLNKPPILGPNKTQDKPPAQEESLRHYTCFIIDNYTQGLAKRMMPLFNRVLVEKIIPPSKTNAGILLPEKTSKLNSGKVIAVGPGIHDKEGNKILVAVKEGDSVLLPEYGGTQVKLGDKEYHLYRDEDILGTLHD